MKKTVSLIIFLILSVLLYSQNSTCRAYVSNPIELPKDFKLLDVVYYSDDQIISISIAKNTKLHFEVYSNKMQYVNENTIELPVNVLDKLRYKETIIIDDKMYFLFWLKDKTTDHEKFFAMEFFPGTLTVSAELKDVAESTALNFGFIETGEVYTFMNRPDYYHTRISADKSKFLFMANSTAFVFDKNMSLLWKQDLLPYGIINTLDITNNGDIVTTVLNVSSHKLSVFSNNKKPFQVPLPENLPDCYFLQTAHNEMYLAGQYTDGINNYTQGVYLLPIDNSYKTGIIIKIAHPATFTNDSIKKDSPKRVSTRAYEMENGTIRIVSEANYDNSYSTTSPNNADREHIIYFSGDLVVTSISKEKVPQWSRSIPKLNKGQTKAELSYYCVPFKDDLYLFFNDQTAGYLANVKMDSHGETTKGSLSQETFKGGVITKRFSGDGKGHVLVYKSRNILCVSLE